MKTNLSISVIILAYNEERHISSCLDAISRQTVMPNEVIVVDNNSTDNTAAIARSYPFVTLVEEKQQGMIYARNTGFDAATGDILARLDSDSQIEEDWIERLTVNYADPEVAAVGGVAWGPVIPELTTKQSTLGSRVYLFAIKLFFNVPILWGPNMSLRKSAWKQIRNETQTDGMLVHEDQDISVLLARHQLNATIDEKLLVSIDVVITRYGEYILRAFRTKRLHRLSGSYQSAHKEYGLIKRIVLGFGFCVPLFVIATLGPVLLGTIAYYAKRVGRYMRAYSFADSTNWRR